MSENLKKILKLLLYTLFAVSLTFYFFAIALNLFLSSEVYKEALVKNNIYSRIYVDFLADPETEKYIQTYLEDEKLKSIVSENFSIITSTLYLLFPPINLETQTEKIIDSHTAFLRGEIEKIDTNTNNLVEDDSVIEPSDMNGIDEIITVVEDKLDEVGNQLGNLQSITKFVSRVTRPLAVFILMLSLIGLLIINKPNYAKVLKKVGVIVVGFGGVGLLISVLVRSFNLNLVNIPSISLQNMAYDVSSSIIMSLTQTLLAFSLLSILIGSCLYLFATWDFRKKLIRKPKYQKKRILYLVGAFIGLTLILFFALIFIESVKPLKCNGHEELCDKRLNEVVFPTTHNSMSVAEYLWLWPSHDGSITDQLNYGIRAFLIDSHYYDVVASVSSYFPDASEEELIQLQAVVDKAGLQSRPGTYLCHLICNIGSTSLVKSLTEIKIFLDENPHEVLVIIFEDKISSKDTEKAFLESGLDRYLHTHKDGTEWPTLAKLIYTNKRLVVMAEVEGPPPNWYRNAWEYTEETPYAFHDIKELNSPNSCVPNRGETDKDFFLLNHWIERVSPSRVDASIVNNHRFLLRRARLCKASRGKLPNFIAVNFFLNGDLIEVVDELNGVSK